ncbi:MAG: type II toxin-antitoxin system VapC family toxin [Aeromicrobium sp.]|nr:type II toxin-antitoxin system VapC family toxin [Burkholderiales bacterium]
MLGIDTNLLVRFLVRDDEAQFEKARKLIKREVSTSGFVFVNQLVLLEAEWVLRSRYAVRKEELIETLSQMLDASDIQIEDEPSVEEALFVWRDRNAEFADCLIGARNRRLGCRATATFDQRALKLPDFVSI